jgi:hypothetical protein
MNSWHILTECYVDTLLAEIVSPPKKGYNHQHCCTKVLGTMKEKFSENAALGIIDDDKSASKDLENFSLLKKHNEQLSLYKHNDKPHYIIKIGKAMEDFILKNAKRCNIELAEYDLPSDLESLKKITKHVNSLKEAKIKVKKVFSALKQNENSDFPKLAQWIELFKTDPYNFNVEAL